VKPSDDDLDALLKRLHLANARRVWRQIVEQAEKEEWSYRDFLALLVAEEIAQRQQTRLGRLSRWASFPFLKTIDDRRASVSSTSTRRVSTRSRLDLPSLDSSPTSRTRVNASTAILLAM